MLLKVQNRMDTNMELFPWFKRFLIKSLQVVRLKVEYAEPTTSKIIIRASLWQIWKTKDILIF